MRRSFLAIEAKGAHLFYKMWKLIYFQFILFVIRWRNELIFCDDDPNSYDDSKIESEEKVTEVPVNCKLKVEDEIGVSCPQANITAVGPSVDKLIDVSSIVSHTSMSCLISR